MLLMLTACRKPTVVYQGQGLVEEVHPDTATVQINHEEIKGFMPAMSMPYHVKDKTMLDALKVGDRVNFTVEDSTSGTVLIDLKKADATGADKKSEPSGSSTNANKNAAPPPKP
ncbi:MAG: copper-binding protein [Acidobacteriota bacterium]